MTENDPGFIEGLDSTAKAVIQFDRQKRKREQLEREANAPPKSYAYFKGSIFIPSYSWDD